LKNSKSKIQKPNKSQYQNLNVQNRFRFLKFVYWCFNFRNRWLYGQTK